MKIFCVFVYCFPHHLVWDGGTGRRLLKKCRNTCQKPLDVALEYFELFYKKEAGLESLQDQKGKLFRMLSASSDLQVKAMSPKESLKYLMIYTYAFGNEGTLTQFPVNKMSLIHKLIEKAGAPGIDFAESHIEMPK